MKNIFLTLTILVSLNAGAVPLTGPDANANSGRSLTPGGTEGSTMEQGTGVCLACIAAQRASRGATGRRALMLSDALNPNLSAAARRAVTVPVVPSNTPADGSGGGQEQSGSAGTGN